MREVAGEAMREVDVDVVVVVRGADGDYGGGKRRREGKERRIQVGRWDWVMEERYVVRP